MALPVYIFDVVDEIDQQSELVTGFINRKTGELTILTTDDYYALKHLDEGGALDELPAWQQEIIPKLQEVSESDDFIQLPSPYEIDEYRIMQRFIWSLEDDKIRQELENLIQGSGAFRRFRDAIDRYDVRNDWWNYKKNAIKRIAVDFLDSEGITWTEEKPEATHHPINF
ncbi:UPF0158 family protein [Rhodohalobacter mucosus]|uniref:Uncharacterized protein n=1 Tax=Rhodohalobacter mucosus TaxID=2079485 RepID=A0A316TQZ0_9BACT|nr:UPF0158 family protein [Rhodohalobacter mucosus]PWN05445.1 hypothetical protein DDZ15_15380 [Rhodohalobacter mucosus]